MFTASRHLVLIYCDLLGDYLIFRHIVRAVMPLLRQRFDAVHWVCNPGVAPLAQVLDADWQPFITFLPVEQADWKRLTLKRLPKLWLQRKSLLQQLNAHNIPSHALELWCPSVAPFEDNTLCALIDSPRKVGRRLESWNLDLLQRWIYTETFDVTDYRQFLLYQHKAFMEQALHSQLPELYLKPITTLPNSCFHPGLTSTLLARKYIALFPESAGAYKEWPPESFASLIEHLLRAKPGLTVVIIGQKPDVADAIIKHLHPNLPVINVVGQTTVLQTLGLIQHSRLVVCNDSFPMHAANALAKPLVCIANGQFEGRYYPYPCEAQFSQHQFVLPTNTDALLSDIKAAQVLDAVLTLL